MAHLVITIGCEYGAKGNQIGKKVAEDLGIKFYDRETVDEIIKEVGIPKDIMEKVEDIFVCPSNFGWSDLGSWSALLMQTHRDLYGNGLLGNNIHLYDSHNCIIHTTQEKKVVIQGLDNFVVAEKDDMLLICKLSEEQRIRQFAEE